MKEQLHIQEHENNVVVITFNRPDARNALSLAMMHAFHREVEALRHRQHLRALILTGAGTNAFCSGGDLEELSRHRSAEDGREFITLMGDALLSMERLPVPVIAAINGYALGGGSEIALACDLRMADAAVKMGLVQINMALTPGWGAGQRLLRLVGYARAMELLLRGEVLDAAALQRWQLVNRVVPTGEALPAALELAQQIASHPPEVVRSIKALLQTGLTETYEDGLRYERALFPALWAADAHHAAVERFLRARAERRRARGD